MAKISLRKALQQKNILVGKIKELQALITVKNSYVEGTPLGSYVDTKATMLELNALQDKLVVLKTAITVANTGIYNTLVKLEEAKSFISFLSGIRTKEGVEDIGYGEHVKSVKYVAQFTEAELFEIKKATRASIESFQEDVDAFNASTSIEVDL